MFLTCFYNANTRLDWITWGRRPTIHKKAAKTGSSSTDFRSNTPKPNIMFFYRLFATLSCGIAMTALIATNAQTSDDELFCGEGFSPLCCVKAVTADAPVAKGMLDVYKVKPPPAPKLM